MKKTQINDIIKGGVKTIAKEVSSLKASILEAKLKGARGEVKNTRLGKIARRTIARLLTAQKILTLTKESK